MITAKIFLKRILLGILLFVVLYPLSAGARNLVPPPKFDSLIRDANMAFYFEAYRNALGDYIEAFELAPGSSDELYNAARAAAQAEYEDLAFRYLFERLEVDETWYRLDFLEEPDLESLHEDARWPVLVDSLTRRNAAYESRFDSSLRSPLLAMQKRYDKAWRRFKKETITGCYDDEFVDSLRRAAGRVNSENAAELVQLLEQHGWLDYARVGDAVAVEFDVLGGTPLETRMRYHKFVKREVKAQHIDRLEYLKFTDHLAVDRGRKQRYGTVVSFKGGEPSVPPCKRPKRVNKLRRQVGLEPMNERLESWGLTWPYD